MGGLLPPFLFLRIINIDIHGAINELKSFMSEFKNIGDYIEFISELNEIKNYLVENFMETRNEDDINIIQLLELIEENIQNDLNKLSTHVSLLEEEIEKEKRGLRP